MSKKVLCLRNTNVSPISNEESIAYAKKEIEFQHKMNWKSIWK